MTDTQRRHSSRSSLALIVAICALLIGLFTLALLIEEGVSDHQTININGCCCDKPSVTATEKEYIPPNGTHNKVSTIPEPGTLALLAAGAVAVAILRPQKSKQPRKSDT